MLPSAAIGRILPGWGTFFRSSNLSYSLSLGNNLSSSSSLSSTSSSTSFLDGERSLSARRRRRSRPVTWSNTIRNNDYCYTSYLRPLSTTATVPSTTVKPMEELYMRQLPSSCIDWNSKDGRQFFREAMMQGTMECYYPLAAQFTTQADPAYCGLGTLTMVLNALNIDPGRIWKGPWRWYSESMLDCCISLSLVQQYGISLDTFACLARCNGAAATVVRVPSSSMTAPNSYTVQPFYTTKNSYTVKEQKEEEEEGLQKFRRTIIEATKTSAGSFLICAYNRQTLGQTGSGHYSPIGAYHQGTDSVLIMDVARFKYPPHWVKVSALYEAMRCIDKDTGLSRGYVTIQRSASVPLVLFAFGLITNTGVPLNNGLSSGQSTISDMKKQQSSSSSSTSCGHTDCSSVPTDASIVTTNHSISSSSTTMTERVNNCHGQGKSVPGAGETLRNAAVSFNETFLPLNSGSSTVLTPALLQQLGEKSIKIALDTFLHIPLTSLSSSTAKNSTSFVTNTVQNPLFPLHDLNDTTGITDASSNTVASSHGTHCMTSLSKEQLSAAAALLTELEHTSLYVMVRQALEQYTLSKHTSRPSTHSRSSNQAMGRDINSSPSHHSVLLSSNMDHAGDDKPIIDDIIPDNSSLKSTEIAGGTVMTLTNEPAPSSFSPSNTECGHKAMTCVRVHTAHVITILLLTLYSSSSSAVTKINHQLRDGNYPLPSRVSTAEILHRLVSHSLPQATILVQGEVQLLRGQLELD